MKKRRDGRYCKQIVIGHKPDGSKIIKTIMGKTKSEVETKAAQVRAEMSVGLDVSNEQSFKDWAELFLTSQQMHLVPAQYRTKKARIEAFYSSIGKLPIKTIKTAHIERTLAEIARINPRTGKPTAEKTLKEYKNACGQVFKYAIKNQAIAYNPCEYAEIPKSTPKQERRALSQEERTRLDILKGDCRLPAMIACYAGLRRGELTALTWDDINLNERFIVVNKSWDFKQKKLKTTKTKAGERAVPITQKLYDELIKVKRKKGLVCTLNGKQLTDGLWEHLMADVLTQIDDAFGAELKDIKVGSKYERLISIQPFGWHDLRHTFCTLCYSAGVDVVSCKEWMGHSDVRTTMGIYTHLSDITLKHSASALDNFIKTVKEENGQSTDRQKKSQVLDT